MAIPIVNCFSRDCIDHLTEYVLRRSTEDVTFCTYDGKRDSCTLNNEWDHIHYHVSWTSIICQACGRNHRSQHLSRFPGARRN